MSYDDHKCEVGRRDLSDLRYDLEWRIEDLQREISNLQETMQYLRQELNSLAERE